VPGDNCNPAGKVELKHIVFHFTLSVMFAQHSTGYAVPLRLLLGENKHAKSANLPIQEYSFGFQGQLDGNVLSFCQILKIDRNLALNWLGHV
jgi:hypothetical protein